MPVSAHYIFIRSPGLASDTEVIKGLGAIRAGLSALKQRQRGCQPIRGKNKSIYSLKELAGRFFRTGCPAHMTNWEKGEKQGQSGRKRNKTNQSRLSP